MILLIDNYDSFTFNIYHYLSEIGAKVNVYRNDEIDINQIIKLNPQAIVLSPGPCTPNKAGICLNLINKCKSLFPILGICLGHQSIGQAFGSKIIRCKEIMHGKIDNIIHFNHTIFDNLEEHFKATRYHSLIIKYNSIPKDMQVIATSKKKMIMGIAHVKYKTFGLQFHPESIGTDIGKNILKNFIKIINE